VKITTESTWRELPLGGKITQPGSATEYETGGWRSKRPIWDFDKCTQCLICWVFCPDSAILIEDGKVIGADLMHCKGCGICAEECPDRTKAITMVDELELRAQEEKQRA
jgi:pyruvate ferredoxin oxidoreductase delta subunit